MYRKKHSLTLNLKASSPLGVTILEVMVTLGLVGILMGIGVSNLRQLNTQSENAAAYVTSFIKQVRARAIAATLAYRIRPISSTYIIAESAANCSATIWTVDSRNKLELPSGSALLDSSWDICFNSRGFPDGNMDIKVRETNGTMRKIEIMLGGATRTL